MRCKLLVRSYFCIISQDNYFFVTTIIKNLLHLSNANFCSTMRTNEVGGIYMKAKSFYGLFLLPLLFFSLVTTSCGISSDLTSESGITETDPRYQIYLLAIDSGYEGTYEDWLTSIRGADGASVLNGTSDPASTLGKDGDTYINTITWDFYVKAGGNWVKVGNIMGAKGDKGDKGDTGEQGPAGNDGQDGEDGKDGVSVVSILKTGSEDSIDTYTITYSDGTTSTFIVVNGVDGDQGIQGIPGADGHTPVITISEDGYWVIDGVKTNTLAQGPKGDKGDVGDKGLDGTSCRTGKGVPNDNLGIDGDSYIDLDTWDYYLKLSGVWIMQGNIKGQNGGDGQDGSDGSNGIDGISITETYINDNGHLIIVLSSGEEIDAGQIVDKTILTVKFYCDDLLVETKNVIRGEKVSKPELEDFIVDNWYIDEELTNKWVFYGYIVTEDMCLYGDFVAADKEVHYSHQNQPLLDNSGYGTSIGTSKNIYVSKAKSDSQAFVELEDRGIIFNKEAINDIKTIEIEIDENGFESAKLFCGKTPLSFDQKYDLSSGANAVDVGSDIQYFTIQNQGTAIKVNDFSIEYAYEKNTVAEELPTIIIDTESNKAITSRETYVNCIVSTEGANKDFNDLVAEIRLRGNSTSYQPKKPYRIKLNKKTQLFGFAKAKNFALLADYMDGSKMHNYSALSFSQLIKEDSSFTPTPIHVRVILNGVDVGLYLFCEHVDEKEGRLNLEQEEIWNFMSFSQFNFMIERDLSTSQDSTEIEGETYFKVNINDTAEYTFALKYPKKDDFVEETSNGEEILHEEEFVSFFGALVEYVTDICESFSLYQEDNSYFELINSKVDIDSLTMFAVVDQLFTETDHRLKSFKMYREAGSLMQFGPNWDYDSCAFGLPYLGEMVLDPYARGSKTFDSRYFGESWGYSLFLDTVNGRPLFKEQWNKLSENVIDDYLHDQLKEQKLISHYIISDCEKWYENQYYAVFDNIRYANDFLINHINYLHSYYQNL